MHRLFVAIRPPEEIVDLVVDIMDDNPALRWVGDDLLHLTLRFIGEVERPVADDVALALGRVQGDPFELRLNGVGRFDRKAGGALWAGVEPRLKVAELASRVDRACIAAGLDPEHRAYHPHVTIARYNRRNGEAARDFERRNSDFSTPRFAVDSFILFESRLSRHGPHYERVETYTLR